MLCKTHLYNIFLLFHDFLNLYFKNVSESVKIFDFSKYLNRAYKIILSSIFLIGISINSFGQQDTISNVKKQINTYSELLHYKEKGKLQFELMTAQNKADEQKVYKYLFLTISGFLMLTGFFIVYVFYVRAKKNEELITVQNREINLRESHIKQLSVILNNTDAPVLIVLADGKIKWMNNAFAEFYGYKLEILQKENKDNFINNIMDSEEKKYIDDCFHNKKGISYRVNAGEGKDFDFQRNITVILNDDNTISGLSVVDNRIPLKV